VKHHFLYKVTHTETRRFYIGMHSTNDLEDGYRGSGFLIRLSIKKYGVNAHTFEILKKCANRKELRELERSHITDEILKNPLCLNRCIGGEGGAIRTGMSHTPETREKIRASLMGHGISDETRAKMSKSSYFRKLKGIPLSEGHRQKLSVSHSGIPSVLKGRPRPESVRLKISQSHKKRQGPSPLKGRVRSEETKRKISEARRKRASV